MQRGDPMNALQALGRAEMDSANRTTQPPASGNATGESGEEVR